MVQTVATGFIPCLFPVLDTTARARWMDSDEPTTMLADKLSAERCGVNKRRLLLPLGMRSPPLMGPWAERLDLEVKAHGLTATKLVLWEWK